MLLPKFAAATTLLMRHAHEEEAKHYGGPNYALSRFLTKYWTPYARKLANGVVADCVECRRRIARPTQQQEGPMPEFRVVAEDEDITPFLSTGMDCAGPYRVKRGRSYETHYLLLLTCCKIRAVRLECMTDLSVDALLMALLRASARGVNPKEVVTDNGANFEAAASIISKLVGDMKEKDIQNIKGDIKWRFNPPYASHYGGVFERMIRAAKEALYHALPAHLTLTLEQLQTAFAVVERILNERPLAYVSTDPADPLPLTPAHFLYGSASVPLHASLADVEGEVSLARKYNVIKEAKERFEQRFKREVRPYMQLNNKYVTHKKGRDLREGDVVVFFMPSGHKKWPLAIVHETFPGRDGRVRTLRLRLPAHNPKNDCAPPKTFLRDVGEVALLLPAERAVL